MNAEKRDTDARNRAKPKSHSLGDYLQPGPSWSTASKPDIGKLISTSSTQISQLQFSTLPAYKMSHPLLKL